MGANKKKQASKHQQRAADPAKRLYYAVFVGAGVLFAVVATYLQTVRNSKPNAFLEWMRTHGAHVHRGVSLATFVHGGFEIRGAATNMPLAEGELIARVPQKLFLSGMSARVGESQIAKHQECDLEDPWDLLSAAGFAHEIQKKATSVLKPFIEMLPTATDMHSFHPFLADDSILADFGELPILRHLRVGHIADMSAMASCFQAWKKAPGSFVAAMAFEEVSAARYLIKTRFNGNGAIPAFFDLVNTGSKSEINVRHSTANGFFEMRASRNLTVGTELINEYCMDCDNEMMLAGWGVYLEKNEHKLNDLQPVNCSISWAGRRERSATVDSLREAALAVLDVAGQEQALLDGWRSPRCLSAAHTAPTVQWSLRCSLARLAWETCAPAWGFSRWSDASKASPAVAAMKEHARIHTGLGVDLAQRGDLPSAARNLQSALRIYPQYLEVHTNLGIILKSLGDLDGAIESFQAAAALDPGNSALKAQLASAKKALVGKRGF